MRRAALLVLLLVLTFGLAFAQDEVLIDFNQLTPDFPADNPVHNSRTILDYSSAAGSSFTDEERAQMRISLAIDDWEVDLSPSSRTVDTISGTLVRPAIVSENAQQFAGETVLGVRVSFPTEPFNGWALVRPPFEIPAYQDLDEIAADGTLTVPQAEETVGRKFDNFGVVKNVGVLRSVSVNVFNNNFPYRLSIILQDENNEQQEIVLGDLANDGWRELTWNNPNYIQSVRNRELRAFPLYPNLAPLRKLIGFRIYRDASVQGGDFVTYIKDVSITFDRAVLDLERDINDEAVWGILEERERARREAELGRVGNVQVLRFIEAQKQFDPEADAGDVQ